jgi:hypothetical protein
MFRRAGLVLAFVASIDVATACEQARPDSDAQHFAEASAVFVGHIFRTEEYDGIDPLDGQRRLMVAADVRPIEVLKGTPPADGKVKSGVFMPGNCSVPLFVGYDYILFLYKDDFLVFGDGSDIFDHDRPEDEERLKTLRTLAKNKTAQ